MTSAHRGPRTSPNILSVKIEFSLQGCYEQWQVAGQFSAEAVNYHLPDAPPDTDRFDSSGFPLH